MIATGNIRDIDKIQERNRRRRINSVFWVLFILSALSGFIYFKMNFVNVSYYLFGFALLMLIILIFRYGLHKKVKLRRTKDDWEKLRSLPNWVYRKMKRKHTNRVNGEHYVYKREGNNFYRKPK